MHFLKSVENTGEVCSISIVKVNQTAMRVELKPKLHVKIKFVIQYYNN